MTEKLQVAIVILNYKGLENTLDCIQSVQKVNKFAHSLRIIVVDNASADGSSEALSKLKYIEFIASPENLGYSGGMNLGINFALKRNANYVILLNNDTYVDENFIENLLKRAKSADIISPKIYFAPGYEFHKDRYKKPDLGKVIWYAGGRMDWENIIGIHNGVDEIDHGQFKTGKITLATGCCMMIAAEVFQKIGLLDEKYFLYLEDMDFCFRAQKAGYKILFDSSSVMWHKNASSAGGSGSKLQDYYITRNRLLFGFRYAKLKTKMALLKSIFLQSKKDPIKRKALIDFLTLKYGKQNF